MRLTITWRNDNPNTIYNKLAARLGREPTNDECRTEIFRILRETTDTLNHFGDHRNVIKTK